MPPGPRNSHALYELGQYDGVAADWSSARTSPLRRIGAAVGRALHLPFTATGKGIRRVTHAHGAGESGLGKLIELHAVNGAGDMLVTIALASTVFFSVPTEEARGRVALYLAITLAPFALLAPVIGPVLDRFPHGRRLAMAGSMLARALLALALSNAVSTGGIELYPEALGVLVASKAYGVVRSAVVPRLLPPRFALVKANSRVTLGGLLATGIAAPVGAGLQMIGSGWPLYAAFAVFCVGAFLAFTLPHKVDSAKGEGKARFISHESHAHPEAQAPHSTGVRGAGASRAAHAPVWLGGLRRGSGRGGRRPKKPGLRTVGPSVLHGLQANATHRALSGFLIFFLAFLLREHPLGERTAAFSLGMVAVGAGVGNALGTAVGAWVRSRTPEPIIAAVLALALGTAILAAVFFNQVTATALGAVAGFTQALSKLSLDALIQRDVPEPVRTSAFARSETLLQMSWVVGGVIGISLPLNGVLGMSVAAAMCGAGAAVTVRGLLTAGRRGSPHPRVA
ncbi:MFS transporter [Streptomyces sp. NPDC051776]|uniref:MFS transporter n=1 Tax=Streptomyces sp. NPDC051776 TaxID=3155414 RepID=UPI00343B6EAA